MQQQAGWLETLEKPLRRQVSYPGGGAERSLSEVELETVRRRCVVEDPRAAAARLRPDSSDAGGEAPVISPSSRRRSSAARRPCALRVELGFVAGGRASLSSRVQRGERERREREGGRESGEGGLPPLVPWPRGRQLPGGPGSTGSDSK
jgi:hypothetical protein